MVRPDPLYIPRATVTAYNGMTGEQFMIQHSFRGTITIKQMLNCLCESYRFNLDTTALVFKNKRLNLLSQALIEEGIDGYVDVGLIQMLEA